MNACIPNMLNLVGSEGGKTAMDRLVGYAAGKSW